MDRPGTAQPNPLLAAWTAPFGLPPFAAIEPAHFGPAFDAALAAHDAEIAAVVDSPEKPSFDNTVAALERSGADLRRVAGVFFNLAGTDTNDALQAIERDMAPRLARHRNAIYLNDDLMARIAAVQADAGTLDAEQARVVDRLATAFRRSGAGLPRETKDRLAAIGERLAALGTSFSQNVLADERDWSLDLSVPDDLAGLPDALVAAAAGAAAERGRPGSHLITLSRSSIEPFLQFSTRRDLREAAFKAWTARGEGGGATDNRVIAAEMIALRAERASLLGFNSFAAFRTADAMAQTPDAVAALLGNVWQPACARALREEAALQDLIARDGDNFILAPWDWRFYAERRRKAEFDLDEGAIKPYFALDRMIEAAFHTASRLFGLTFTPQPDLVLHHPDARAWHVTRGGADVGLFIGDYYARPSKRSGAWMSALRDQARLDGDVRPIINNVMNFAGPLPGEACLLSFDDARTLFHEFGHALHGLLSSVTYPSIAGTNVARDFVEFPSQLFEHWLDQPEILKRFARHHATDATMPDDLLERVRKARNFNQGFATVEYTASALVDLELHQASPGSVDDVVAFEKSTLARLGMPAGIVMRHRTPHFAHVFSGEGYSSAYYSYLWSEILDADGFDAFLERGDIFDPETAKLLHDNVYAAGNRRDPHEAYRAFRGRAPDTTALLRKRGLVEAAAGDA